MLVQPIDGNFGLGPASGPSKPLTHTSTTALRQRRPFPPPGINPTVLVAFSKPSLKVSSRAHLGSFQPDRHHAAAPQAGRDEGPDSYDAS
jgi:hypothetical protein